MNELNLDFFSKRDNGIWYSKSVSKISYPDHGNAACYQLEDGSFWFKHRNSAIIGLIRKFAPNATFWDIGGGNGFVAKGIQDAGIRSILVEPGETGCVNASSRGLENVICATLQDAKLDSETINSCGLFDVLEHIEDDAAFLKGLNASMAKGGHVFLTVPALNSLWSREDVHAGHYRRYTMSSIRDVFEKQGFKVLYVSYFFSPLVIPIFLFRSLPRLLGFQNNADDTEKYQKEHGADNEKSLSKSVIDWFLKRELVQLEKLSKRFIGSSCILVAVKE